MEEERKVSVITEQQSGQVKIADEVVAIIAGLAISDVKGIITLSSRKNKRSYGKGIGIRIDGNDVYCDLAVVLKTGYKVQQVALPVQQKVKAGIENMTGLNVREVNVCIVGIQKEKNEDGE